MEIYIVHLLESIISKGDVHESDNTRQADVELAAQEIIYLLKPLTILLSMGNHAANLGKSERLAHLYRDVWFNIIVHGIIPTSGLGEQYISELQALAAGSVSLITYDRANDFESEIDLNTVLRRGMNASHTIEQKRKLTSLLPRCEPDIKTLSYPKVIFLNATYQVETLRANAGVCNHILTYFLDPSINGSAMGNCMAAIADKVLDIYLERMGETRQREDSASLIAEQLAFLFSGCCHRILRVQQIAAICADRIINQMPSSLCQRSSMFALLELLTIMWKSCLEAETDEYDWTSTFRSARGEVTIELSDDYAFRKNTLHNFYKRAKSWVSRVINIAPLDVKGLLQVIICSFGLVT